MTIQKIQSPTGVKKNYSHLFFFTNSRILVSKLEILEPYIRILHTWYKREKNDHDFLMKDPDNPKKSNVFEIFLP